MQWSRRGVRSREGTVVRVRRVGEDVLGLVLAGEKGGFGLGSGLAMVVICRYQSEMPTSACAHGSVRLRD
jgi:hypothetical protein